MCKARLDPKDDRSIGIYCQLEIHHYGDHKWTFDEMHKIPSQRGTITWQNIQKKDSQNISGNF